MIVSRFFRDSDEVIYNMDGFDILPTWWSRFYEYAWVIKFLSADDTILDAGCGLEHPFKDYAAARVKKVIAIDNDEGILSMVPVANIEFHKMDMLNLEFAPQTFDKIFCVSVIEHIPNRLSDILGQFKTVLKDDGQIILTIDYPSVTPEELTAAMDKVGLEYVGETDFDIPEDAVFGYGYLYCFRAILKKKGDACDDT